MGNLLMCLPIDVQNFLILSKKVKPTFHKKSSAFSLGLVVLYTPRVMDENRLLQLSSMYTLMFMPLSLRALIFYLCPSFVGLVSPFVSGSEHSTITSLHYPICLFVPFSDVILHYVLLMWAMITPELIGHRKYD